ncbi:MAG: SDR family oxidoreductase [Porticoccaceae bacterium]
MKNIVVVGATSTIARATARLFAQRGANLYLLARSQEKLESMKADLKVRGATSVKFGYLDVNDLEQHHIAIERACEALGEVDVFLISHGTLPDQKACERDFSVALREINTNGIGTLSLLTLIANHLENQGSGTIAVITSVAGERGRQSNYVYGTAKGMVSIFLQGLRNRLFKSGVHVLDIKPGFVDTPMTAEFTKGVLWSQPESVAEDIVKAVEKRKHILYTPFFWRLIMTVIRLIPEAVFKRMKL